MASGSAGLRANPLACADILDIKPVNMEELTEVITAAEFHPVSCNLFCYSSSKGTVKLADMREQALCDKHAKREFALFAFGMRRSSWGAGGTSRGMRAS